MCYAKKKSTYPIPAPIVARTSATNTGSQNNIYVLVFLKELGMEERKSMMKSGMRVLEGRYVKKRGKKFDMAINTAFVSGDRARARLGEALSETEFNGLAEDFRMKLVSLVKAYLENGVLHADELTG